jgi:uronate dehydrogenase
LSVGDAIRCVDACLRTSDLGFAIVYGISNNTRTWWDLAGVRAGSVVTSSEPLITDRREGG